MLGLAIGLVVVLLCCATCANVFTSQRGSAVLAEDETKSLTYVVDGLVYTGDDTLLSEYVVGVETVLPEPTKKGHTFSGWYEEPGLSTPKSAVLDTDTLDLTLYGEFTINTYTLTINYTIAPGATNPPIAPAEYTTNITYGVWYAHESPVITGFTPTISMVAGTMGDKNVNVAVVYNVNKYTLKILYVFAASAENTPNTPAEYTQTVAYGSEYSVNTQPLAGYTPNEEIVSGTMGLGHVTETVTYEPNEYVLTIKVGKNTFDFDVVYGEVLDLLTLEDIVVEKDGYRFLGFADKNTGMFLNLVDNLMLYEFAGSITIEVVWEKIPADLLWLYLIIAGVCLAALIALMVTFSVSLKKRKR